MDWQTTVPALQGIISLAIAVAAFYFARKKDTQEDATQQAKIATYLEAMREDVAEIKKDMKSMHDDWKQDHDDIVKMKSSIEAMWKRIDEYSRHLKGEKK